MPTGYTADVQSGKITDFRTFALRCARAFGACVLQRDESMDALPAKQAPSDYHEKQITVAKLEIARLVKMGDVESDRCARDAHGDAVRGYETALAKNAEEQARYRSMLAQAEAWTAPTPEHEGLRKFMIEQLTESIRFDSHEPTKPTRKTGAEWIAEMVAAAQWSLNYHTEEHAKELARCDERNGWIAALYKGLGTP